MLKGLAITGVLFAGLFVCVDAQRTSYPTSKTQTSQQPSPSVSQVTVKKDDAPALQTNTNKEQAGNKDKPLWIALPAKDVYDWIAYVANLLLVAVGMAGIVVAACTLVKIERQTEATENAAIATQASAEATEASVTAMKRSIEVQEAEFFQWLDMGRWKVEKDFEFRWNEINGRIQNPGHPLKMRISFPLINNTTRPLSITSVGVSLEIGPDKTCREFVVEERWEVPPKDEYSVVIDTIFSESHVTQYVALRLFIIAAVRVNFLNALGKAGEAKFLRMVDCRAGEKSITTSKGHIAKETSPQAN